MSTLTQFGVSLPPPSYEWAILTRGADHDIPNTSAYKCMLPDNPGSTLRQIGGGLVYGPTRSFPLVDELALLPPFS